MIKFVRYRTPPVQAALVGCLLLLACENDEGELRALTERKVMVEEARSVVSFFSQQGAVKAKVTAPLMLRYQVDTSYVEFPKSLHVDFFDAEKKVQSWLDARYGRYSEMSNRVLLRDSVRVINVAGDTLTTSELWWSQSEKKFYTDKEVRIATKDKRIYGGKGLEAAEDISWYIIRQPTGTLLVPESYSVQ